MMGYKKYFGILAGSLVVALAVMTVTPPNWMWFDLLGVTMLMLLAAAYCVVVLNTERQIKSRPRCNSPLPSESNVSDQDFEHVRYRLKSDTHIVNVTRRKGVVLVPAVIALGAVVLLIVAAIALRVFYPAIEYTIPAMDLSPTDSIKPTQATDHSFAVWWIPLLFALPLLYIALAVWQDWKWKMYAIVYGVGLITVRVHSVYFFWMGQSFDPTPADQIVDVDDKAGALGSTFGWGTVTYKIWLGKQTEDAREDKIRFIPNSQQFAHDLKFVSPALAHMIDSAPSEEVSELAPDYAASSEDDTVQPDEPIAADDVSDDDTAVIDYQPDRA